MTSRFNEFDEVDDLAMALDQGDEVADSFLAPRNLCLGSALEVLALFQTAADNSPLKKLGGLVPRWVTEGIAACHQGGPLNASTTPADMEFFSVANLHATSTESPFWTAFCTRFDLAARSSGCSYDSGKALTATMREMVDNALSHSKRPDSAVVCYHRRDGTFEFAVTDMGIGVLASLRSVPEFAALNCSQAAMYALTQGASVRGPSGGYGYKTLFRVLEKTAALLRCRSGDAVLQLGRGDDPRRGPPIYVRPNTQGLTVSVLTTTSDVV